MKAIQHPLDTHAREKTRVIRLSSLLILLALLMPLGARAACSGSSPNYTAASTSTVDVQACITLAVNGDTVHIPAGSSTWSSGITIAGVGVTIIGTGTQNNGGATVGAGTSTTNLTISSAVPFFTFTGLTFGQTAKVELMNLDTSTTGAIAAVSFSGTCTASGCAQIRVDNLNFVAGDWGTMNGAPVVVDNMYGVIDHLSMNEAAAPSAFLTMISHSAWLGVGTQGYNSFASADTFGTASSIFMENNNVGHVRLLDNDVAPTGGAVGGARYVCRFNTITNMAGNGLCGAHGTAWGGPFRGQRQEEVYYNTLTTTAACNAINGVNSGTGYFLSNTITGNTCNFTTILDIARLDGSPAPVAPWFNCDGTGVMDPTPWSTTSFCLDQPGSGAGVLYTVFGGNPNNVALASSPGTQCTTAGQCPPSAALDPIYTAGEVTPNNAGVGVNNGGLRILANRDYYAQVSDVANSGCPGSCTPFTGAGGTGFGTLSQRPTSCTTGVGYWATDQGTWNTFNSQQGTLYKCVSTNTWGTLYTPYTYPHPLDAASGTTPPVAPATVMFTFNAVPVPQTTPAPVIGSVKPASTYRGSLGVSQDAKTWSSTLNLSLTGTNFTLGAGSCTYASTSIPCTCGSSTSCTAAIPASLIPIPTVATKQTAFMAVPAVVPPPVLP